jgi:hypothetical protein
MKKLIFVLMAAALAFSCNDNRSSERNDEYDDTDTEAVEPLDDDSDTSSTWDQDRDRNHDDNMNDDQLDNDESGARRDTTAVEDRDRSDLEKDDDGHR